MRRALLRSVLAGSLLSILVASSALGAHCINSSKPNGAGNHTDVVIDAVTGEVIFSGANPAGRLTGGFADVYLQLPDGTLVPLVDDTFLAANHSGKANPAQGDPAVLPAIKDGKDPGGPDRGVGGAN